MFSRSQYFDRIILNTQTQLTFTSNLHVLDCANTLWNDVQWFWPWFDVVGCLHIPKAQPDLLPDGLHEYLLRGHLQWVFWHENYCHLRVGNIGRTLGCGLERTKLWELLEDEDFDGDGFCAYVFWDSSENSKLSEEISDRNGVLWHVTETWTAFHNSGVFGVLDSQEVADRFHRTWVNSSIDHQLNDWTVFGMELEPQT